jgi:hypothetical protein
MALTVGFSATALAGPVPFMKDTNGRPQNFERGEAASYAIWHTSTDAWRLDVTTAGYRHHFKGRVWIEGTGQFGPVLQWKGAGEAKSEEENDNWFKKAIVRQNNDRELVFDILSEDKNVSGVLFKVEGTGRLRWELGIGGPKDSDRVAYLPARVKVGHGAQNPPSLPFETWAHPAAGR